MNTQDNEIEKVIRDSSNPIEEIIGGVWERIPHPVSSKVKDYRIEVGKYLSSALTLYGTAQREAGKKEGRQEGYAKFAETMIRWPQGLLADRVEEAKAIRAQALKEAVEVVEKWGKENTREDSGAIHYRLPEILEALQSLTDKTI